MFDDLVGGLTDIVGGIPGLGNLGVVGEKLQNLQGQISPDLLGRLTTLATEHGIDTSQIASLGESLQSLGADQKGQIGELINQIPGLDRGIVERLQAYLK